MFLLSIYELKGIKLSPFPSHEPRVTVNMAEQVFLEKDEKDAAAFEHSQRSSRTGSYARFSFSF